MFDSKKMEDFTTKYLEYCKNNPISSITKEEGEKVYNTLIDILGYHNWMYYVKSKPTLADTQYDALFSYLKQIETTFPELIREDSPTQRLTYQLQSEFEQWHHKKPLLSLENTYNAQDIITWNDSIIKLLQKAWVENHTFLCEPKYDGISIELVYKDGILKEAITRWDGYVWEKITANIKTLFSVPVYLKWPKKTKSLRLRGEVVMNKKALERINEEREQAWEQKFVNVRNAASWSIRQLDTSITAKRWLIFYVYEVLEMIFESDNQFFQNQKPFSKDTEILQRLWQQWFQTPEWHKKVATIKEVVDICESATTKNYFDSQDIAFDGIVVKIDELATRELLGSTNHHPRWAMAYKFPAQQTTTQLLSVDYQVWRTGVITPTANLQPVELWWVTISRASLHNFDYIQDKDILIGDRVWLQRSGEVIPYVVWSIEEKRTWEEQKILPPEKCPVCDWEIKKWKSDIYVYCVNPQCPAKLREQLLYFAARDSAYIDGLGDSLVDLLLEKGLVKSIADLYTLEEPQKRLEILAQAGVWQRKYMTLIEEINKTKNAPLWRLLNGLGITHIGKKTAQLITEAIAEHLTEKDKTGKQKDFFNAEQLAEILCDEEFLNSIKGIWPEIITALQTRFENPTNKELLKQMSDSGVQRNNFANKTILKGKLTGISFCITGTFLLPRKVITDVLTKHGAVVSENLTKQTTFLLAGEEPSSKLKKAQDDNIPVIDWLDRLQQKFEFLKDDISSMQLFAREKKPQMPKQEWLFG